MKRLDRLLENAFEQRAIPKAAKAWQALSRWPEVVGEGMAARSWPDRFEGGTVYVAVSGSAWAQELRMQKPVILERLGQLLGNRALVLDVRFGVRELPLERMEAAKRPAAPRKQDPADLEFQELKAKILSRVEDDS